MTYQEIKNLKAEDFKRLFGVNFETFNQMIEVVKKGVPLKKKTGRPSKLSIEEQVLITLEYWREDRTYFHLGKSWGVDESTAYRIIRKIENILIQAQDFRLPGKKKLIQDDNQLKTVLIDVSETPIERPKKNKSNTTAARKNDIL